MRVCQDPGWQKQVFGVMESSCTQVMVMTTHICACAKMHTRYAHRKRESVLLISFKIKLTTTSF